jgi:hypothetical protein
MPSSTSHRASFDRGLLAVLFVGIAGAPLIWLAALQTGYVLAYQACDDRSRAWVVVPTIVALALVVGVAVLAAATARRAAAGRLPLPMLARAAIAISILMVVVLAASAVGPLLLHPCD